MEITYNHQRFLPKNKPFDVVEPSEIAEDYEGVVKVQEYEPDLPEGYSFAIKAIDRNEAEVEIIGYPPDVPTKISRLQGRIELKRRGLLNQIVDQVENFQDEEAKMAWQDAAVWEIDSPLVDYIANQFQVDKVEFFQSAKKINK